MPKGVDKTAFFPHAVHGCDQTTVRKKVADTHKKFLQVLTETGSYVKADKYLTEVADRAKCEATGRDVVVAVKTDAAMLFEDAIARETNSTPAELTANLIRRAYAEPSVKVKSSDKDGLTVEISTDPRIKLEAARTIAKVANLSGKNKVESPLSGMSVQELYKLQKALENTRQVQKPDDNNDTPAEPKPTAV